MSFILARLPGGHGTSAEALQITSWLYDVARPFAQCGEAQAGTPAQRYSLCYAMDFAPIGSKSCGGHGCPELQRKIICKTYQ